MKVRTLLIACVALLLLSLTASLSAQVRGKARRGRQPSTTRKAYGINPGVAEVKNAGQPAGFRIAGTNFAAAAENPAGSLFTVGVDSTLQLDSGQATLYQNMADRLSAVTNVPNDRSNYYSAFDASLIEGWEGIVTDVTSNGNGYLVTVSVVPSLVTSDGAIAVALTNYSERYQVSNNNSVAYVDFQDPNGWAGQSSLETYEY